MSGIAVATLAVFTVLYVCQEDLCTRDFQPFE